MKESWRLAMRQADCKLTQRIRAATLDSEMQVINVTGLWSFIKTGSGEILSYTQEYLVIPSLPGPEESRLPADPERRDESVPCLVGEFIALQFHVFHFYLSSLLYRSLMCFGVASFHCSCTFPLLLFSVSPFCFSFFLQRDVVVSQEAMSTTC